jgi:hypothetical protein
VRHKLIDCDLGAGLTIAVVWNSNALFVTHNMRRGVTVLSALLQTGQMRDLEPNPIVPMMGYSVGSGTPFSSVLAWPLWSSRISS